jgi:L,D-transpeptidase YbiS
MTTDPIAGQKPPARSSREGIAYGIGIVAIFVVVVLFSHRLRDPLAGWLISSRVASEQPDSAATAQKLGMLRRRFTAITPKGAYLVVSSSDNQFRLMRGEDTLRAGLCSTGSYVKLTAGDGRTWLFSTPRGGFRVQEKRVNPVWSKPDWAFIEAGLPVPGAGDLLRFERGVLGDYALSLGDGYLVHGTPYQRLLGMPVTHGCVRLGDDDLEIVFRSMPTGSRVILY